MSKKKVAKKAEPEEDFDKYDYTYIKDKYDPKKMSCTLGTFNDIKAAFAFIDDNHNGEIDPAELKDELDKCKKEIKKQFPDFDVDSVIDMIMEQVDANGDGKIQFNEFFEIMEKEPVMDLTKRENCDKLYDEFTNKGEKPLDKKTLEKVSKELMFDDDPEMIEKMIFYADLDEDGEVNPDEFYQILNPDPEKIMEKAKQWRDDHKEAEAPKKKKK